MNPVAESDRALTKWFGRISVISFGLVLLIWNEFGKRGSQGAMVLCLSFLCVSTILALLASYKQRMGWLYLIPPAIIWTFIIAIKMLGPFH